MAAEARPADPSMITALAAALVRSVPTELPADGQLPPDSIAWRVHGDLAGPVAAIRSLLVQALHPLAMAGVHQHSAWRADPFGRLAATAGYVNVLTYGSRASAAAFAARVRAIHERVHGADAETGVAYAATDPTLLLWVHNAMVDSFIAAVDRFGTPLSADEADGYCREMAIFATLIGIPDNDIPLSRAELQASMDATVEELRFSAAAREAIPLLLDPPELDDDIGASWHDIGQAAIASLPTWALERYGWAGHAFTPEYRTEIRQVLGAIDFALELEPGVVEARERILGWTRAARVS